MGFSWKTLGKKVLEFGRPLAGIFIPQLEASIQAVEEVVEGFRDGEVSGPEKKARAIAAAQQVVVSLEGAVGQDILNDPKVIEATGGFVDAYVHAQNARVALIEAVQSAQQARNPEDGSTTGGGS
jgi:hypothetical protein